MTESERRQSVQDLQWERDHKGWKWFITPRVYVVKEPASLEAVKILANKGKKRG